MYDDVIIAETEPEFPDVETVESIIADACGDAWGDRDDEPNDDERDGWVI